MPLLLVRHGESEGNAGGFVQGRLDFGLTERGRLQAEATGRHLSVLTIDRVISSPLRRAAETASLIGALTGHSIEHDEGLQEYDMGAASGLTGPQIRERYPEVVTARQKGIPFHFPGEEGREEFHARVAVSLERALALPGRTLAIAHGGVIAAICYQVLGLDIHKRGMFETANCAITEVVLDRAGRRVLLRHNDVCHLAGLRTDLDRG